MPLPFLYLLIGVVVLSIGAGSLFAQEQSGGRQALFAPNVFQSAFNAYPSLSGHTVPTIVHTDLRRSDHWFSKNAEIPSRILIDCINGMSNCGLQNSARDVAYSSWIGDRLAAKWFYAVSGMNVFMHAYFEPESLSIYTTRDGKLAVRFQPGGQYAPDRFMQSDAWRLDENNVHGVHHAAREVGQTARPLPYYTLTSGLHLQPGGTHGSHLFLHAEESRPVFQQWNGTLLHLQLRFHGGQQDARMKHATGMDRE